MSIRFSNNHLVYNLTSVIEMVYSPAFNVTMFTWSMPVAIPFFISRNAASTSHDVISGTSFDPVGIMVLCALSYGSVRYLVVL